MGYTPPPLPPRMLKTMTHVGVHGDSVNDKFRRKTVDWQWFILIFNIAAAVAIARWLS